MSLLLLFPAVASGDESLDGTGSQLTLAGGTAEFSITWAGEWTAIPVVRWIPTGGVYRQSWTTRVSYHPIPYIPPVTGAVSLDGTGSQLTLSGGNATLTASANLWLDGTGSALALTGGNATLTDTRNVWLTATGSQVTLSGGTAALSDTRHIWLTATGSALALSGGTATLTDTRHVWLTATGGTLALTGGTATLDVGGDVSLVGTGTALALTGGTATLTAGGNVALDATGAVLTLSGGTASFAVGSNLALIATGSALTLTGGAASFDVTGVAADDEQPSGGWSAYNAADAERQRRKRLLQEEDEEERERQELADALESVLVAEGTLKPVDADLLRLRGMAQQYSDGLPNRAARALAYAERAQTEMATQLALREMAKLQEDEEYALLLILAAA